jgi:hypothetical protein
MFFMSFFLGGLSQLLLWTFAHSYAAVMAFSVIYGLVGCWFLGLIPVVCAQLFGLHDHATITGLMVLVNSPGLFCAPRLCILPMFFLGQLAGASIGGAVFAASGGSWTAVTMYSGGTMLLGSFIALHARFSYERRIWAKA